MTNLQALLDVLNPAAGIADLASRAIDPSGAAVVDNVQAAGDSQAIAATANYAAQQAQSAQAAEQNLAQTAVNTVPGASALAWLTSPAVLIGGAIVGGLIVLGLAHSALKRIV